MKLLQITNVKIFLIVFYLVGILGFCLPYTQPLFMQLTPLALVFNVLFLIYFHKPVKLSNYVIMAVVAILGFIIEVVGVKTGKIFGVYAYGTSLGPKFLNTPYLIGLNWLVLTYCATVILGAFFQSRLIIALLGAFIITAFDIIMEPVAIFTGMWTWMNGVIPLQNYIMWFVISFLFVFLFAWQSRDNKNPMAHYIFLLQVVFFAILHLVIKFFLV